MLYQTLLRFLLKNSIVNSVRIDDWKVEYVIIASNVNSVCVDDWTIECAIIASSDFLSKPLVYKQQKTVEIEFE